MNSYPEIKEYLRKRYYVDFNNIHKWHIGQYGITQLSSRIIKYKPSEDINTLKEKLNNLNKFESSSKNVKNSGRKYKIIK